MLSSSSIALLNSGCRIASRGLSPLQAASSNLLQCQQVRFARKTFGLRYRYGLMPFFTDHMYDEAVENKQLDDLAYKQIRFNNHWETNSPLQDDVLEKYLRYMERDGRRWLMYELLHNTLYEIKTLQYRRYKKIQAKKEAAAAAAAAQNADTKKKVANSTDAIRVEDESEELILDPIELFNRAVENCKPFVVTTKIKRGGATYQVPTPIRPGESEYMAMKWLNDTVKDRPKPRKRHYHEELAQEIIDAANMRGKVIKKRDDIHKLAQANKAYSHYRWG